ncbi:hypothetical protein Tco_0563599 [Tanacetum coccineum]
MLRVRCNSGEEYQYHLDQMQNYLKSDIVWESRKEDLSLQIPKKPTQVYQSCARDPKAPPMTMLNQDLFYLKHDNSGPKKYVISLHKYPAVPFLENDLEELTSRWVSKCFKRFNLYARYSVKHWKNLWAKQHHIRRHEKKKDNPDEVYLESKIVEVVRTLYKLGVHDYQLGLESYQQRVNLTAPTITFPGIERKKLLTLTSKLVVGLIYENNKKEKRVMIIKEIPKFCNATLIRFLELVEKMNMDVKKGYADLKLSDNDAEYLRFNKEYIKDRLRHRDQMRCWDMYVNVRPLGSRRDSPE